MAEDKDGGCEGIFRGETGGIAALPGQPVSSSSSGQTPYPEISRLKYQNTLVFCLNISRGIEEDLAEARVPELEHRVKRLVL
jgi:hypothetical protein